MRDEFYSKFTGKQIDDAVDYVLNGQIPSISVDNVLSTQSENPVQNKVITNKINEIDETLNVKADSDSVYTKSETDNLLNMKADSDSVYTKSETNGLLLEKMENPMTSAGDMIYAGPNGTPTALAKGTATQVLKATTTGVEWSNKIVNYSTSEIVIGEWIDGKPIYRKVIDNISLTNGTEVIISSGISSAHIITLKAVIHDGFNHELVIPNYIHNNLYGYIYYDPTTGNIHIFITGTTGSNGILIVEYTK